MTELEVRTRWNEALTRWERGEFSLSSIIGWGFYQQDLLVLCCLHEGGKHTQSIVDLLEDCNFHTESILLKSKQYNYFRKYIVENMDDDEFPFF